MTQRNISNQSLLAALKKRFPAFQWSRNPDGEIYGWITNTVNNRWISVIRNTNDLTIYLFDASGKVLDEQNGKVSKLNDLCKNLP